MLKKESNQLVSIINISESLNTRRVTRQQSAQTNASVPLGSTYVTTKVVNLLLVTISPLRKTIHFE